MITNKSSFMVKDYLQKKMLSRMGYTFSPDELESWEVESYETIELAFDEERARKEKQGA